MLVWKLQVDVLIDETYAEDPPEYDFNAFLQTFNLTSNATSNATYPFLQHSAVFRYAVCACGSFMTAKQNRDIISKHLTLPGFTTKVTATRDVNVSLLGFAAP